MTKSTQHKDTTAVVDFKLMKVSSPAFRNNGLIPAKYTCDGDNVSPPLNLERIPGEAKCPALIVEDPDAPIRTWVHWIVWNIPVTHHLKENAVCGKKEINDFQIGNYRGPCPPKGTHRYFFKVYALDETLNIPADTTKFQLERVMGEHIVGFGELIGLYKRK